MRFSFSRSNLLSDMPQPSNLNPENLTGKLTKDCAFGTNPVKPGTAARRALGDLPAPLGNTGSPPVVTLTTDTTYSRGRPIVNSSVPMPPDMSMLVEVSVAGGPRKVDARAMAPTRTVSGITLATANAVA